MSEQEIKVRSRTSRFVVPYIVLGLFVVLALGLVVLIRALADQGLLGTPASPYSDTPSHSEDERIKDRAYRAAYHAAKPYLQEASEHLRNGVTALEDAFDEVRRYALLNRDNQDVVNYHNGLLKDVQDITTVGIYSVGCHVGPCSPDPYPSHIISLYKYLGGEYKERRGKTFEHNMGVWSKAASDSSRAIRPYHESGQGRTTEAAIALLQAADRHFLSALDLIDHAIDVWNDAWRDQRIADGVVEKL